MLLLKRSHVAHHRGRPEGYTAPAGARGMFAGYILRRVRDRALSSPTDNSCRHRGGTSINIRLFGAIRHRRARSSGRRGRSRSRRGRFGRGRRWFTWFSDGWLWPVLPVHSLLMKECSRECHLCVPRRIKVPIPSPVTAVQTIVNQQVAKQYRRPPAARKFPGRALSEISCFVKSKKKNSPVADLKGGGCEICLSCQSSPAESSASRGVASDTNAIALQSCTTVQPAWPWPPGRMPAHRLPGMAGLSGRGYTQRPKPSLWALTIFSPNSSL